jgi:hypothetical protein
MARGNYLNLVVSILIFRGGFSLKSAIRGLGQAAKVPVVK